MYKVYVIKVVYVPTKVRDVKQFVVIVNYYRDMWHNRAHTLATLITLCTTKVRFNWTYMQGEFHNNFPGSMVSNFAGNL